MLTVLGTDTVVCLRPLQLKTLNSQIALLIEHHQTCTATVKKADEIIEAYKANEASLKQVITNDKQIIDNQEKQIFNLKTHSKNTKKIWLRRALYAGCGGLAAGVVAGVLIR